MTRGTRFVRPYVWAVRSSTRRAIGLVAVAGLLVGTFVERVDVQSTQTQSAPTGQGSVSKLTPAAAAQLARETRQQTALQIAAGLELSVWAPEGLVADAMAIDFDSRGVAYVTASPRSGQLLDIRQHPDWVPEVHTLKTVEDLRQFFRRVMAPERSAANTWLPDYNKDGTRDYRDLASLKERIYRVEDTDGDGVADRSLVAFEGFHEDVAADIAGGLMVHGSDLYVTVAPDLWRLRDTNGDKVFDVKESISHGYSIHPAFSGHDMSAVTQGPDGRIYWKIGDIGLNVVDRTGKRWAYPNQGAVMRSDPDGSNFEVFATGLRNTQEMAFDAHGNLVSVDNDGDHAGETERVVYIMQGSDTGWRSTWQYGKYTDPKNNRYNVWMDEQLFKPQFAGQAAYVTPPIAPYNAGPSGFAYNPGTALADRWRDHFFVTSFPGGAANARVYAFQLKENGAGFSLGTSTEIVRGVLTPGMKIGPDGALYLTDWVRGWGASGEGKIWRLDTPGASTSPARVDVRTLLSDDITPKSPATLRTMLRHADQRVRLRAQFELVRRRDSATLVSSATETVDQLSRIHAIWGLGQLGRADRTQLASIRGFLRDSDPEIRAQAAKMLGDARDTDAADALVPLLSDPAPRVRFFAAEALGRAGATSAMGALVGMLAANNDTDVYLRTAGIHALASLGNRTGLAALRSHASRSVRLAAVVALRRLRDAGVAGFLDDADPLVVTEAARAINDEGGIVAALPALAQLIDRPITGEPLIRRVLNANLRVGGSQTAGRLGAFIRRAGVPNNLRVEAVQILGVWVSPSTMDRVDGEYLGTTLQGRDSSGAAEVLASLVPLIEAPDSPAELKIAVMESTARLGLKTATPTLLGRLRQDTSPQVRVAAFNALQALGGTDAAEASRLAMADADGSVRMTAIAAMDKLSLPEAAKVDLLSKIIAQTSASVGERQSAVAVLGGLTGAEARKQVEVLIDGINAGTLPAGLQLDVLEVASKNKALLTRLDRLRKTPAPDSWVTAYPQALETGGSATRGMQVATQHPAAQCSRCHSLRGTGATVGPPMDGVGKRLSRAELVQSLIDPSARIAPGFGIVSVTLKNGQRVDGTLKNETPTEVVITVTDQGDRRIPKTEIANRSAAVSAMPPMGALLQPRELRDVVEFLTQQ